MGGAQQPAGRRPVRRLAHEDLGGDAHDAIRLADLGQGVGDRRGRAEDDHLRRHHPAGRALLVRQQALQGVGFLGIERGEDPLLLLARHLAHEVGEVVELHLLEHVDQAIEVEALHEAHLLVLGELLEQVGESLVVHRRRQLAPLRRRQRPHDRRHLRRVAIAEAGRLGRDAGDRWEQAGHLGHVDEAEGRAPPHDVPAHEAQLDDLVLGAPRALDGLQPDVADRLVVDPLVDDLGAEQHLAGVAVEGVEVEVPAAQPDAVVAELGDAVGVDEDAPALALGDEPGDPRRGPGERRHGDDVLDAPDGRAGGVEQRQAHDAERPDQLAGHTAERTDGRAGRSEMALPNLGGNLATARSGRGSSHRWRGSRPEGALVTSRPDWGALLSRRRWRR